MSQTLEFWIGFNLLMIVFCGRLVEASVGPGGVIVAYLIGAYVACAAQSGSAPFYATPFEKRPTIRYTETIANGLSGARSTSP